VRAIQITEFGRPEDVLHVIDVPAPPSPGPFEVKVTVEFSPLNKHDLRRPSWRKCRPE
jgi:NADPH:quinone reductase-like Zn-dependent oxidoreductase